MAQVEINKDLKVLVQVRNDFFGTSTDMATLLEKLLYGTHKRVSEKEIGSMRLDHEVDKDA